MVPKAGSVDLSAGLIEKSPAPPGWSVGSVLRGTDPLHRAIDSAAQAPPLDTSSVGGFFKSAGADLGAGAVRLFSPLAHPIDTLSALSQTAGQIATGDTPAENMVRPFISNPGGEAIAALPQAALMGAGGAEVEDAAESIPSRSPKLVPGENFTESQMKSHAAVTAEGNAGANPNFIPQDIAKQTGSIIRDTAAQNPQDVAAINGNDPVAALQAHKAIIRQAQTAIDQSHNAILGQVRNVPVDTTSIQRSIMPTQAQLQAIDPEDLNTIQNLRARAAGVTTLDGLNEFRKYMNVEDTTLRGNPTYAKSVGTPELVHQMANSTRNAYYDALQQATGEDFSGIKRIEGGLIQQQGALQGATPRLAAAEAKANAPFDARTFVGNTIESAPQLTRGSVLGPALSKVGGMVRGGKLDQLQRQLQNFYSDLPTSPTVRLPGPALYSPYTPHTGPALQLPAQAGAPYAQPGMVPYSPTMTPGERSAAMMQYLRQRQQLGLPGQGVPIQLPSQF
jgi:hypothetical protein